MQVPHSAPDSPRRPIIPSTAGVLPPLATSQDSSVALVENRAEWLIRQKHDEYAAASRRYRGLYYALRLSAGLSAGFLPFVVSTVPVLATVLSATIVVVTVVDMVFNPKDRWKLFSRTADLLTMERLKRTGEYKGYESLLSLLTSTESAKLESLVTLEEVTKKANEALPR